MYVWHHSHYVYHIICTTCDLTFTILEITLLYVWHKVHSIWPNFQCISVITPTLSMILQPLCIWPHIQYMCDITSTIFVTYYPLSMTSQHSVLMTQHSAYVWYPLHCRWQRTHSITPNHSIYDVTSTCGMTTQPLYQKSHQLYLCHHIVSTVISPTFVWHHTHHLCDIIWTVYYITPNPYVITLLHLWHHRLYIRNHIQYEGNINT